MREEIKAAQIAAMKAGDKARLSAIRLIQAGIKNRDIELRTASETTDDDALIQDVLAKMAKQRRESIEMFRSGGRDALAEAEMAELKVIESFLPAQLDDAQAEKAVAQIVAESGASGMKDMGRVMGLVKEKLAGQIDMGRASSLVKAQLAKS